MSKGWDQLDKDKRTVSQMVRGRKPIPRTAEGLRDALFDQLEQLNSGESELDTAKAFASVSNAILKSVEVELSFHKARARGEIKSEVKSEFLEPPNDATQTKSLAGAASGGKPEEAVAPSGKVEKG